MQKRNRFLKPPKSAQQLLRYLLRDELIEEVSGDLEERYANTIDEKTKFKADLDYWYQTVNYLRPFALRKDLFQDLKPFFMFRHNIKITLRNIRRNTGTFFINLSGLTIGMACVFLILLWGIDEWRIDKFHNHSDRLYQVFQNMSNEGDIFTTHSTPWPLAQTLAEDMPEVQFASVATPPYWYAGQTLIYEDQSVRATGHYVAPDYFKIFTYPLLYGDRELVLRDKLSIVLSRKMANILFGSVDKAIGQTVNFQQEKDFIVTGVMEDIPDQSSKHFDFALPAVLLIDEDESRRDWGNSGPYTFLMLKEGVDPNQFESRIRKLIHTKTDDTHRELILQKYTDNYLYGRFENGIQSGGRIEYLRLFILVAVFILVIACINFMNLSTARASRRLKEIGVKKSIGATRESLIAQYLGESILICFFSLLASIALTSVLLPQFNLITGKQLSLSFGPMWILGGLGIALMTGLLAGSYPALYLSGFKPLDVLKGRIASSQGAAWARRSLVIFQFVLSVLFIVLVAVAYMQMSYVRNKNLGYSKENVIYFDIEGNVKDKLETFLSEIKSINGIEDASSSSESIVGDGNTNHIEWEGKDPSLLLPFRIRGANHGLLDMLEFDLIEGRGYPRDRAKFGDAVFNEAGIRAMGMEDPIGKTISFGEMTCEIVGVVKDYHYTSLHSKIEPLFFVYAPEYTEKIMVKITSGMEQEALAQLQSFYSEYNPEFTFKYRFLDNDYQQLYAGEQRVATLARYSAGLAILISCLGLLGLVAFSAERRRREIGIRKVLGASNLSVVGLLGKEFSTMVITAIVIALPLSYHFARGWLSDFAYKIELHWWLFFGAGVAAMLIAWLTVSIITMHAARANPVESLRIE